MFDECIINNSKSISPNEDISKVVNDSSESSLNQRRALKQQNIENNLNETMQRGGVFLRAIPLIPVTFDGSDMDEPNYNPKCNFWEFEVKQLANKNGFKLRSFTMAGTGVTLYGPIGYGCIDPNSKDINQVALDMNFCMSGYGKNKELMHVFDDMTVDLRIVVTN